MMLLAFGKEQAWVYCGTCWHQYCSLLSPKLESHHEGKKLAPTFPLRLLSLAAVSWEGIELALEWLVLRQKSHLLDARSILMFSKTLATTADAQLSLSFLDALLSEGSRQTLKILFSLTGHKARAHQPDSLALFPVFFILRHISLYSGFPVF